MTQFADDHEEYQHVIINNNVSKTTGNIAVGSSPSILIKGQFIYHKI